MSSSKDHVAGLAIQIPEQMIRDVILAEVTKSLGATEDIVRGVVREAVAAKRNNYDKHTIFEAEIQKAIRKVCEEVFHEWLDGKREEIRAALLKELEARKGKRIKEIADQLATSFAQVSIYGIKLHIPEDDR